MKNKTAPKEFQVTPGEKVNLQQWPTRVKPFCESKKEYKKLLKKQVGELSSQQRLHYASNRYALLLIFQAMDAADKDGAIRHVMSGVNPQGCQVFSFQQPSAEELDHDFLWRTTRRLPERGRIGIFNAAWSRNTTPPDSPRRLIEWATSWDRFCGNGSPCVALSSSRISDPSIRNSHGRWVGG